MPNILAIDTSSELASVALSNGAAIISREASGVQTHSQTVLPMVQTVLKEAGLRIADCDAIAFGAGPGSFTGVRTACGVAQGLAFGLNLPVIPVGTLLAMAQACRERYGAEDVLAVLDARMEEVYWAQYRFRNGWQTVIEPALSAASSVRPDGAPLACGNGFAAYASAFAGWPHANGARMEVIPHAAQIAALAQFELAAGRTVSARDAQPVYLRNKVAMTTAERMSRAAA